MIRSAVRNSCSKCRQWSRRPPYETLLLPVLLPQRYRVRPTYDLNVSFVHQSMCSYVYGATVHGFPSSILRFTTRTQEPHTSFMPGNNQNTPMKTMKWKRKLNSFRCCSVLNQRRNELPVQEVLPRIYCRSFSQLLLSTTTTRTPPRNATGRWNSSSNHSSDAKKNDKPASVQSDTPTAATTTTSSSSSFTTTSTTTPGNISSSSDTNASSTVEDTSSSLHPSHHPTSSGKGVSDAVVAATHDLEQRIKRVVRGENLTIGDQLSVALIAIFTTILLTAPYTIRHMKQRANTVQGYEDRLQTDDPVDEFVKLARHEWNMVNGSVDDDEEINEGNEEKNQKFIEVILQDVLQSKTVQHAAQEFVVQIIQSERFQSTIQHFVKELWSDLVTDPETIAQVIKLLEIAITSTPIKNAVIELILQIAVRETEFRDAMIQMIQQLGMDDDVRNAVVQLLTEAAHTTLNDPDIFDHSMEFATDVVGDDIVQQTAGEALRKSVEHAVKPATTILLSACGVGLLIFSFIALGYSRSSESETRVFASAARSLQSNAAIGMSRILNWPFRTLPNVLSRTFHTLCNYLSTPLRQMGVSVHDTLSSVAMGIVAALGRGVRATGRWLSAMGSKVIHSVSAFVYKHSVATINVFGIWIGTATLTIATFMESGIRSICIHSWMYTRQGLLYVGQSLWEITLHATTYVGRRIAHFITAIYDSITSCDEW